MKQQKQGARRRGVPMFRTGARLALARLVVALLCLAGFLPPASAAPRKLQRVNAASPDGAVYIDWNSIQRTGATVRFLYILDLPIAYSSPNEERRYHSNEIDLIIDCGARTSTFISVREYAGAAGSGNPTGGYTEPPKTRKPENLTPGSTFADLAGYVCPK
jgi:hypothetical protein